MHTEVVLRVMRPFPLLLALLMHPSLAGCAVSAVERGGADAPPFVPYDAAGAFFVEPSRGNELSRTEVLFLVNATGRTATATVTIGSRLGGADLPRSTAYLEVQMLDETGEAVSEGRRMPLGEAAMVLRTDELPAGAATLVILVGGGSDKEANGDHVAYRITVE